MTLRSRLTPFRRLSTPPDVEPPRSRLADRVRRWMRHAQALPQVFRPLLRATRSRAARIAAVIVVGLLGGWIGVLLGGHIVTPIGPADVALSVRPSFNGGTTIDIPPLGTVRLNSHWGPLRLEAQVAELRPDPARRLIENPGEFQQLTDAVAGEVRHGLIVLTIRSVLFGAACALLTGLVVFRSWRRALTCGASALAGMAAIGTLAAVTFNPQSVAEPRYTGLLVNAPQVVGSARSIVRNFAAYRAELAQLVTNVSRLYAATSTLPTYAPDPSTIRVMQVSDIHLNPLAWSVMRSIADQFQVQLIIDSGDLTDHGSKPEQRFADDISSFNVPYVFVRGNHDSFDIQKAVARQKNAVVLDGTASDVAGLRIYGVGDPRFTPDKTTRGDSVGNLALWAEGKRRAIALQTVRPAPDIVVTHDPSEGEAFDGTTPLILTGHVHVRSTRLLTTGTRLFIQGSTGGAGLRGLEGEQPTPIELSILYFDRQTHRLQGWDDIRLGGLGLTSAQIERTLEPQPDRPITPPARIPSLSPTFPTPAPSSP